MKNEMFSIEGKVAIITGAGGVLGISIAKSFAHHGAKVVVLDIRQEQLDTHLPRVSISSPVR